MASPIQARSRKPKVEKKETPTTNRTPAAHEQAASRMKQPIIVSVEECQKQKIESWQLINAARWHSHKARHQDASEEDKQRHFAIATRLEVMADALDNADFQERMH